MIDVIRRYVMGRPPARKDTDMDELVQLMVKTAGITEQQARIAIPEVIDYLEKALPDPVAEEIDLVAHAQHADAEQTRSLGLFSIP